MGDALLEHPRRGLWQTTRHHGALETQLACASRIAGWMISAQIRRLEERYRVTLSKAGNWPLAARSARPRLSVKSERLVGFSELQLACHIAGDIEENPVADVRPQ